MKTRERRLLLIDDDPVSVDVLRLVLGASNFQVTSATGPAEALDLMNDPALAFDVILTDVQMPGMGSNELIQALKARSRATLIVMSGSNPDKSVLAGADGFLLKPFDGESLIALLGNLPDPYRQQTHAPRILDAGKLLQAMPKAAARNVYHVYLEDLPLRLEHLRKAVAPPDAPALAKEAHILHGSSAMIGAEELASATSALEEAASRPAAETSNCDDLVRLVREICNAASRLKDMLNDNLVDPIGKQE